MVWLKQVQAVTPSFNWNQYFSAMHTQAQPNYLVTAPDVLPRGRETDRVRIGWTTGKPTCGFPFFVWKLHR